MPLLQQHRHPGFERTIGDVAADGFHQPDQGPQVMDGYKGSGQQLLRHDQVTKVGTREGPAGIAIAGFVDRAFVAGEGGVHEVEPPIGGEGRMMAGQTGRQDTIEDIDAAQHPVDQVFGSADTHQIARLVFGVEGLHYIQHGVHFGLGLPHRQPADGDAGGIEGGNEFSGSRPQVRVDAALDDSKQGLVGTRLRLEAAFRPAMSAFHCHFAVAMVVGVRAFVEGHDDVGAEVLLDGDRLFGREAMGRTVDVALEGHAVIVYLAGLGQGEDLIAARIGEHGTRPLHELVQAAHVPDEFIAGTQVEVIGVGQHQRGIDALEVLGREGLDGGLGANRCEDRGEQVAVRGGEDPGTGTVVA